MRACRRTWLNLLLAILVAAGLIYLSARGFGTVPALGAAFNPGTGVWTSAADAQLPHSETLLIPGLQRPASVVFEPNGTAHIRAATDHDLFLVTGYLHARFRLFQMDLERRQGEGLLSQVVGGAALSLDKFELKLGLIRTAQRELRTMSPGTRAVLEAYSQGVNDRIDEDKRNHSMPLLFHMLGFEPSPWTPLDTLAIKGDMTQTLDFTDSPLDYAVLVRTLGYQQTMSWFPVLPPNAQHPYDPGPYHRHGLVPLPAQQPVSAAEYREVASLHAVLSALGVVHQGGNSNNWAVSGAMTASGKPLMAGDPHLHQTLPAIWYQLSQDSPHYHVTGVSIPGTPVVLIGHNRHISWSLTDTQNQATLYYLEWTDPSHPGQYYWRGAYRRMRHIQYTIPVKNSSPVHLTVDQTVHGPIIDDDRLLHQTISVDWMGNVPSQDLEVLLRLARASSFAQFREALRDWQAPTQNFIYADDAGPIGIIAPGLYPIVKSGAEWLPLQGTGESDVAGSIPFADVPQAYDPPGHLLFSANQRPVSARYPYYVGTTLDFFDNGYRANRIYQVLHGRHNLTVRDMERLQTDLHDYLALRLLPLVLDAIPLRAVTRTGAWALGILNHWDGSMDVNSAGASIWWTFWRDYVRDTFGPWWSEYHVPANEFDSLKLGPEQTPLNEDLEAWTLHDPTNPAFSLPDGTKRTASTVIRRAFNEAVAHLQKQLGGDPGRWDWGRLHQREFSSLAEIPALGYGPRPAGGDLWTVNAASGEFRSDSGPSWRFIMDWGTGKSEGVYPGGQSENPASPWYENEIPAWWNGRYSAMRDYAAARRAPGTVVWSLKP